MENYILYLAYGSKDIIHQTIFSILSLYKSSPSAAKDIQIVIYTDRSDYFKMLIPEIDVEYLPINQQTIQEWKGDINFFFRAKIKLIEDFFSKYQNSNLLYLDSDTFFKEDILPVFKKIANGEYFMHEYEGVYDQKSKDRRKFSTAKTINKILQTQEFVDSKGQKFKISNQTELWNAGVLGFNAGFVPVLPEVVLLTEQLYRLKDAHVMEQFSFSYYLQKSKPLNGLNKVILHYWNFKEFNEPLNLFFTKHKDSSLVRMMDKISQIDPERLIAPKMKYLAMPFFKKNYNKYFNGKWKMPEYKITN